MVYRRLAYIHLRNIRHDAVYGPARIARPGVTAEVSLNLKDEDPALGSISLMPLPIEAQSLRSHALELLVEGVHFFIVPRVL